MCVFYIEFVKSATTVVEIVDGKNSYLVLVLTAVLQLCWGIKSEKLLLWSDTKTYRGLAEPSPRKPEGSECILVSRLAVLAFLTYTGTKPYLHN